MLNWPAKIYIIRHGQSSGNTARDAAHLAGHERIALDHRDVDVPLSELGRQQSKALGEWFAANVTHLPDIVLSSPYERALQSAQIFRDAGGCPPDVPVCRDERLREKEFGILDGLTTLGVRSLEPEQAAFRETLGKFYHRPPGGESWVDVIFRLRAMLDSISLHHSGETVIIFAHQVVVLCLRYILESLTEAEILAIDKSADVANCSITEYQLQAGGSDGKLQLVRYNFVAPLKDAGTSATDEPDYMVAARG